MSKTKYIDAASLSQAYGDSYDSYVGMYNNVRSPKQYVFVWIDSRLRAEENYYALSISYSSVQLLVAHGSKADVARVSTNGSYNDGEFLDLEPYKWTLTRSGVGIVAAIKDASTGFVGTAIGGWSDETWLNLINAVRSVKYDPILKPVSWRDNWYKFAAICDSDVVDEGNEEDAASGGRSHDKTKIKLAKKFFSKL